MATYKPIRKTANGTEEIKIPYAVLADPPTIPDISGKANLSGGNTFTGKQTLNSPASDGYSINAAGYIKGSWLQAPSTGKASSNTGLVCVLDGSGWVYYRTPAEIVSDGGGATTDQIPTVNNGTLTIQKNGTTVQTFTANQSGNATANITVPTKVSELTNDSGFTKNKGTVTQVKINGVTKNPNANGLVDLGSVSASIKTLTITQNGNVLGTFDGTSDVTINIPSAQASASVAGNDYY